MKWREELNIGNDVIDEQHKKIVKMISQLQNAISDGSANQELGRILKGIVTYTQTHFETEEKIMQSYQYPDLESHAKLHVKLVESVRGILLDIKSGKLINPFDMIEFLKKWLVDHIVAEDLKIGEHIRKKIAQAKIDPLGEFGGKKDHVEPLGQKDLENLVDKSQTSQQKNK